MEAAGLVLGAVPILIGVLKLYKTGKNLTDRVRNRKKHIESLMLALQGHQAALTGYLEWLLKGADVWEEQDDNVGLLFADAAVVKAVTAFVGASSAQAIGSALEACQEAIATVARSIDNFLPPESSAISAATDVSLVISKYGTRKDISAWKGVKLALSRSELQAQIQKIDAATSIIDRLQSIHTAIGQLDSSRPSRQCRRWTRELANVGRHAERLYQAFTDGWSADCHPQHRVELSLEDRVLSTKSVKSETDEIKFHVMFAGDGKRASEIPLWREHDILAVQEDSYEGGTVNNPPTKVRIATPIPSERQYPRSKYQEISNICLSLAEAEDMERELQLYVLSIPQFYCCYGQDVHHSQSSERGNNKTVSLADLMASSSQVQRRADKISLRSRLRLALILTSATVQLNSTRWLRQPWAKANIHFLVPSLENTRPADVDLSQPLISEVFNGKASPSPSPPRARQVLLELGIILLELWNETTLEEYYADTMYSLRPDYFTRLSLAQRWLEESNAGVLPIYYDVVARCVKCHFDGIPVDPDWKEPSLQTELIKTVVEPLQKQCRVDT